MVSRRDWNVAQVSEPTLHTRIDHRYIGPHGGFEDRGHSDRAFNGLQAKSTFMDRQGVYAHSGHVILI